ncbi:MAG: hypothetical protein MUD06_14200 [Rhodospirillales bacterium]|jgi:hypothetical protein|nr:hypothetical protein [Rhodospirillales bacterium]
MVVKLQQTGSSAHAPRGGNVAARAAAAAKRLANEAINRLPPVQARQLVYACYYRRLPNLSEPRSFNEKVHWRVAHDRRPLLVQASSKVESKELAHRLAPEIRVPRTLWHGDDLNELARLKVDVRWVLKASHRAGCILVGTPEELQPERLRELTKGWLDEFEFRRYGLWAYSRVRREYILEELIDDLESPPIDYKFFVFAGRIGMIQVDVGRFGDFHRNLYTEDWTPLPHTYTHPRGPDMPRPPNWDAMCTAARKLGACFDFVRVDLYNVEGRVYFGELTIYPSGGCSRWPEELDMEMGALWSLPSLNRSGGGEDDAAPS